MKWILREDGTPVMPPETGCLWPLGAALALFILTAVVFISAVL